MNTYLRAGIVTLAATVGLGTAGLAVANAGTEPQEPLVKREDTSSSWTQSTNLDDDDLRDDLDDSPTINTVNTAPTAPTANTAPTAPTVDTATNNTVKTVPSTPTRNTAPTSGTN